MTAVVVSIPFLVILWRRPLVRRFALRSIARRPREALLVVSGTALATALIVGAISVGDTFTESARRAAVEEPGPIDEIATFSNRAQWAEGARRLRERRPPVLGASLPIAVVPLPIVTRTRAAPRAQVVEVDFAATRALGPPSATGVDGRNPGPGRAAASASLARRLQVGPGDPVELRSSDGVTQLVVDRVLPQRGVAAFRWGVGSVAENLLVAPGTLPTAPRPDGALDIGGPTWAVAATHAGGDTPASAARAAEAMERVLRGLSPTVATAKQDAIDAAAANGRRMTRFFGILGAFGVLAGVFLVINVFALLAIDRGPELGMLRAVGLRRRTLLAVLALEGWVYALAGALIGLPAGVGLGRGMVAVVDAIMSRPTARLSEVFPLHFAISRSGLERGLGGGLIVGLGTLLVLAFRISRTDVIAAIRDLPAQPPRRLGHRAAIGISAIAGGAAVGLQGLATGDDATRLVAPVLIVGGAVVLVPPGRRRTVAVSLAAAATIVWAGAVFPSLANQTDAARVVLQGAILAGAGVVLVVEHLDRSARVLLGLAGNRPALGGRLGLAYPVGRRLRTGLTLAPLALVGLATSFTGVFQAMFDADRMATEVAGGYDVVVRAGFNQEVGIAEIAADPAVRQLAPLATVPIQVATDERAPRPWVLSAFDERFLSAQPPVLLDRGPYRNDAAAYRDVLRNPDLVIAENSLAQPIERFAFLDTGDVQPLEVGDVITVVDPVTSSGRELRVAALASGDATLTGVLYGRPGAASLFGTRLVENRAFAAVSGPPQEAARRLGVRLADRGVEAVPIRDLTDSVAAFVERVNLLDRTYVALGVVIGVASIGVVMARAVRERRHEIGVLRAVGVEVRHIRRGFVYEAGFIASQGALIGVALGVLVAFTSSQASPFVALSGTASQFRVPWVLVTGIVALLVVSALAAAARPAQAAARIPPAMALRLVD